jgi:ubiquinone/menaquinone biosynthesis C-methylase UbiE
MYAESATYYDAIYSSRYDFAAGAGVIREVVNRCKQFEGSTLLDVACGTGAYLVHFRDHFTVEGLDSSSEMLAIARAKLPEVRLHEANMIDFNLGRRFDVIVCLGSSIGYVKSAANLRRTLSTFARHLEPGGVVLVEPWFFPQVWENGRVTADLTDEPNLKIARILVSGLSGRLSTFDIYNLVARGNAVHSFTEHHELGLFTHEEHVDSFQSAGLRVDYDPKGPMGRGLYIGTPSP